MTGRLLGAGPGVLGVLLGGGAVRDVGGGAVQRIVQPGRARGCVAKHRHSDPQRTTSSARPVAPGPSGARPRRPAQHHAHAIVGPSSASPAAQAGYDGGVTNSRDGDFDAILAEATGRNPDDPSAIAGPHGARRIPGARDTRINDGADVDGEHEPADSRRRNSLTGLDRLHDRIATLPYGERILRWIGPILVVFVAAGTRLWNLGSPHSLVFDETFYVKDAYTLLKNGYESSWPAQANDSFNAG
ncbi:MAG: phospholipid carrier-dependent glycosyltransferase, partial [Glaciihabitans sp.]|nr:phospholipid carrier-dependent glycosyltransferase [Glaciihabitans sp.]